MKVYPETLGTALIDEEGTEDRESNSWKNEMSKSGSEIKSERQEEPEKQIGETSGSETKIVVVCPN